MKRLRHLTFAALAIAALGALVLVPSALAAPKVITGYIGNAASGTSAVPGQFNNPSGVAVNYPAVNDGHPGADGDVYVLDRSNNRVQRFNADKTLDRIWGFNVVTSGPGQADEVQTVTVKATAGQFKLTFGASTTGDLAFNASAAAVQSALNGLTSVSAGGGSVTVTGGPGDLAGSTPYRVVFNGGPLAGSDVASLLAANGTTPLSGSTGATVATPYPGATSFEVCVPANGDTCASAASTSGAAGGQLNPGGASPGIAIDQSDGSVYVTDGSNRRIQKYDADGNFLYVFGFDVSTINTSALFEVCTYASGDVCKAGTTTGITTPQGGQLSASTAQIATDPAGNLYVADRGVSRVSKFSFPGGLPVFERAWGQDVVSSGPGQAGNEIQNVFVAAGAGQFNLTFGSGGVGVATTTDLAFNASAAEVQTALNALTNISAGGGSVSVSGGPGDPLGNTPYVVTFDGGPLQSTNVAQLTAANGGVSLSGGTFGSSAFASTLTQGGTGYEVCVAANGDVCKNGTSGSGVGQFSSNNPNLIATDTSGHVYVGEPSSTLRIQRFDSSGANPTVFGAAPLAVSTGFVYADGIAVDPANDHVYVLRAVVINGERDITELDSSGNLVERHMVGSNLANSWGDLALNPTSGVLYGSSIANVNGSAYHRVYTVDNAAFGGAAVTVAAPTNVESTTATLNGTVNPNGFPPAQYRFEVSTDGNTWNPVGSFVDVGEGTSPVPVSANVTALGPNTFYRVRLVATKSFGGAGATSPELNFLTDAAPPEVLTSPIGLRTSTTAELRGAVDPNATATTYWFEYGPDTNYGTIVPLFPASAGSGDEVSFVSQQVAGLSPATTYHYRVVADGFGPPVFGADKVFATKDAPLPPLDFGPRGYELVSPAVKTTGPGVGGHGNQSALDGEFNLQTGLASSDGERFISVGSLGPVLSPASAVVNNNYSLAERTDSGWLNRASLNRANFSHLQSLNAPFLDFSGANASLSRLSFNNRGGSVFLFPAYDALDWGATAAVPKYVRDWQGNWEILQPTDPAQGSAGSGGVSFTYSADGSALVIDGSVRGVAGPTDPSLDQIAGKTPYLVDLSAGPSDTFPGASAQVPLGVCAGAGSDRTLIPDRLPSGKLGAQSCPVPAASRSEALISPRGAAANRAGSSGGNGTARNAVSPDGSRVYFMSPDPAVTGSGESACTSDSGPASKCPAQLYLRSYDADGEPVVRWISRPQVPNQDASLLAPAYFEGASADGDKVFFRTASPLTADDPNGACGAPCTTGAASASSSDLYMYDLPDAPGADPGAGSLVRITAGPTGFADSNSVARGGVAGSEGASLRFLSEDGGRVYFTTAAPLPGVPDPSDGTITSPGGTTAIGGETNLYLYDSSRPLADRWEFIARIPRAFDANPAACASTGAALGRPRSSQLPGSGPGFNTFLYTLDSGVNCVSGRPDGRLIVFWTVGRLTADDPDAASADVYAFDADGDDLTRLSASRGGPGGSYVCDNGGDNSRSVRCHGDTGFSSFGSALNLDGFPPSVAVDPARPSAKIAYFESRARLLAADQNNAMDVYQWRDGDLSLVSSGAPASDGAYYAGNSIDGQDVFLVTRDALTWQDIDAVRDVYDARLGGGFAEPLAPPSCAVLDDACQGATLTTPVSSAASTAAIHSEGNFKGAKPKPRHCPKGKVRRAGKCVSKKKRKAGHAQRAKQTNHDRRAAR